MADFQNKVCKDNKKHLKQVEVVMRLLVDCHCFDEGENQGINTYIREIYKSLVPIAPDIQLVFAAQNLDKLKSMFGEHRNVEYVGLGNHNKYYRLAIELPSLVKAHAIDAIHCQYTSPAIKNCKTIVTIHDILFEDFPTYFPLGYRMSKHLLFKSSALRADLLLTVSDYSRKRIAAKYNIREERIVVTHNGVSGDFFGLDEGECAEYIKKEYGISKYILYVSRFEPRKKQVALLNAYKNLRLDKKGYQLVFIGIKTIEDPLFDGALAGCDEEMRRHIHILENVPYKSLLKWYGGARLFVYPSEAEGFGIPPLEAAASGVPVICNNKTAMADFTFFCENLISTDDVTLLESRMKVLLKEERNNASLAQVRKEIASRYSWDKIALKYKKSLESTFGI